MNTSYTFEEISLLYEARQYLTKERFDHYFSVKHGLRDDEIKPLWELWNKFPHFFRNSYNTKPTNFLIGSIIAFIKDWQQGWAVSLRAISSNKKDQRMIIYKEGDEVKKAEIDLLNPPDIFLYADLLRRPIEVVDVLFFLEEIDAGKYFSDSSKGEKTIKVYEGDIFTNNDNYWREDRNSMYIVEKSRGGSGYSASYRQLLYTKGKGYLKNGEPNIDDDESYNQHVLTMADSWRKIGNLVTDMHLLKD